MEKEVSVMIGCGMIIQQEHVEIFFVLITSKHKFLFSYPLINQKSIIMVHRFYTIRTLFLCLSCSVCLLFACQSEKPTTVATTETTEKTETVAETLTAVEETAPVAEAKSAPIASTTNTEKPVVKVVEASVGATKPIDTKAVASKVDTSSTAMKPTPRLKLSFL